MLLTHGESWGWEVTDRWTLPSMGRVGGALDELDSLGNTGQLSFTWSVGSVFPASVNHQFSWAHSCDIPDGELHRQYSSLVDINKCSTPAVLMMRGERADTA